ncbi:MFS transporter [Streptacidiphilus melanogenes]|uniref:MFS transporter n=1 Tax=Streptacidiphilus melanogenes TaxID=411235 RepID=UPI0006944142|nr:MFS transporter [Streptacidiphilus melanogenes]
MQQTLQRVLAAVVPRPGHERRLAAINLAYAIGRGVFLSGSVIYFTGITGLSAAQVGLGSSAAALSGFGSTFLSGVLADRVGAKRMLVLLFALQVVGFSLYPAVHSAVAFYVLISAVGFVEYGVGPTLGALVSEVTPPDQRVQVRAILRTMFNIGFSVGSALTAVALLGGHTLLRVLPWASAVLLLGAALLILRVPGSTTPPGIGRRPMGALRDLRFLSVTALSVPLALHASILLVALPLWTVTRTSAPHALVPVLMIGNTILCVFLQVHTSKGAETVRGAARLARRAGLWLVGGCAAAAATAYGGAVVASVVLCVSLLLFTMAELDQSASGWGLAHGLAPENAQGEYLGAYHLHIVAQGVLGPGIVAAATTSYRAWGWAAIAVVVLVAGLVIVPVADAAERRRVAAAAAAGNVEVEDVASVGNGEVASVETVAGVESGAAR